MNQTDLTQALQNILNERYSDLRSRGAIREVAWKRALSDVQFMTEEALDSLEPEGWAQEEAEDDTLRT